MKISKRVAEEGRNHPFVELLVRELKAQRVNALNRLEANMSGEETHHGAYLAGRAGALRDVIRDIETAGDGDDE